jgi:hypothetical protein
MASHKGSPEGDEVKRGRSRSPYVPLSKPVRSSTQVLKPQPTGWLSKGTLRRKFTVTISGPYPPEGGLGEVTDPPEGEVTDPPKGEVTDSPEGLGEELEKELKQMMSDSESTPEEDRKSLMELLNSAPKERSEASSGSGSQLFGKLKSQPSNGSKSEDPSGSKPMAEAGINEPVEMTQRSEDPLQ